MEIVMSIKAWLKNNTETLRARTVAISGSTGGIGRELCRHMGALSANLLLLDRSSERSEAHRKELLTLFPEISVECLKLDLEDIESVKRVTEELKRRKIDFLINNAGAYSIPRHRCSGGFDNVFTINFVSPYYMTRELLPTVSEQGGRVVAVGSIAHNYSKSDENDIDFSTRGRASLVYGNAKRYLMYAATELSLEYAGAISVTHPGICFTNITAHYPKPIFALIKHPMKAIFMSPKKASLCILKGLFVPTDGDVWIGPRAFNIWGYPKKKSLKTADEKERAAIAERAEKIYGILKRK